MTHTQRLLRAPALFAAKMLSRRRLRCTFLAAVSVALLAVAVPLAQAASGGGASARIYTVPSSVPSDCSADAAGGLLRWGHTVPDHSVLQLAPDGCYRLDRSLLIPDRHDLTIDGNGATIRFGSKPQSPAFLVVGGSSITLRHMTIIGPHPKPVFDRSYQFAAGVWLQGVQGATLSGLTIKNVYGDFVTLERDKSTGEPSRDVTIEHSTFHNAGRQGIAFVSVDGADVNDVSLTGVGQTTYDVEPIATFNVVKNVTIEHTTSTPPSYLWFVASVPVGGTVSGITIRHNTMTGVHGGPVVRVKGPGTVSGVVVKDNNLRAGSSRYSGAFDLTRCDDCRFTGNTVFFQNDEHASGYHERAATLRRSRGVAFDANILHGPGRLSADRCSTYSATDTTVYLAGHHAPIVIPDRSDDSTAWYCSLRSSGVRGWLAGLFR